MSIVADLISRPHIGEEKRGEKMAKKNHRVYVDKNEVQEPRFEDQNHEPESSSTSEVVEEPKEEKKEEKIRHRDKRGQSKTFGRANGKKSCGGNRNGKKPASRICHNKVSGQTRGRSVR